MPTWSCRDYWPSELQETNRTTDDCSYPHNCQSKNNDDHNEVYSCYICGSDGFDKGDLCSCTSSRIVWVGGLSLYVAIMKVIMKDLCHGARCLNGMRPLMWARCVQENYPECCTFGTKSRLEHTTLHIGWAKRLREYLRTGKHPSKATWLEARSRSRTSLPLQRLASTLELAICSSTWFLLLSCHQV